MNRYIASGEEVGEMVLVPRCLTKRVREGGSGGRKRGERRRIGGMEVESREEGEKKGD